MTDILKKLTVDDIGDGSRLDLFLSERLEGLTRSRVGKLIGAGRVLVEGKAVKAGTRVKKDTNVEIHIPQVKPLLIEPEAIPVKIAYEDEFLVVVDKPAGMVVHPSAGHSVGTLVHALLHHCQKLSPIGGWERPGIVHRLDKDTSGLLIVAKEEQSHLKLCEQLQKRTVQRFYSAITHGAIKEDSGIIEAEIGRHPIDRKRMWVNPRRGRKAISEFAVVERFNGFTLSRVKLKTGRTHQIRVHMAYKGFPIVGDEVYGGKRKRKCNGVDKLLIGRQALHAYKLGFIHPHDGKYLEFESPLPEDMTELIEKIRRF